MGVTHVGSTPPPVLHLSDGGHIENLGLLPLLKRKLGKIVVVDGGVKEDEGLGSTLFIALKHAREKLYCSFSGINGRDIYEDFRRKFTDKPHEKQPRSYRFKVEYSHNSGDEDYENKEEGEILYIQPRHPKHGLSGERKNWHDIAGNVRIEMEADAWGTGPEVEPEEVDRLTCCCCECCHCLPLRLLSEGCCGVFPNHVTANQFFTPIMFSAYHREGYRACTEARVVEFLAGSEESKG